MRGSIVPGEGRGCVPGGRSHPRQHCACSGRPGTFRCCGSAAGIGLTTCKVMCGTPGAPTDPSLTQADRFLLVFRVCFCLAPFEIGYDVGGKAAAPKPRAGSGEPPPAVSWRTHGQRVRKDHRAPFPLTSLTAFMIPYCRSKREPNVF